MPTNLVAQVHEQLQADGNLLVTDAGAFVFAYRDTPAAGREDVVLALDPVTLQVINGTALSNNTKGTVVADGPKALAISADGALLFAAFYHTWLNTGVVAIVDVVTEGAEREAGPDDLCRMDAWPGAGTGRRSC